MPVTESEATQVLAKLKVMRPDVERAVQVLQRGEDVALEQALALLQNTVFSFSMRVCGHREGAKDTMRKKCCSSRFRTCPNSTVPKP
jgi:hypothetical protein